MKESVRRIFSITGVIGLLAFSVITINQVANVCANGQFNCMSAAVTFGIVGDTTVPTTAMEMSHAAPTTITASDNVPTMASFVFTLVQVTSVYLILLSVIALVILELFELRYLRQLVARKTV